MTSIAAGDSATLQTIAGAVLGVAASALARSLVDLDVDLARGSLRRAALRRLRHYAVRATLGGAPLDRARSPLPARGPLLIVANHPGLYDALLLFAAIGREDLGVLAARRELLTALPHLAARMVFVDEGARGAFALKRALRHLGEGRALLHFPAGTIEPDAARVHGSALLPWRPGLDALLAAGERRGVRAVAACVAGVVSPRARTTAARLAGRAGATDAIVPLLQLTLPAFRDVAPTVAFGPVREGEIDPQVLREDLEALVLVARAKQP